MKILELFESLLYEHKFVEAHKALEPMWKEYKKVDKDEANILKGFINATTAIALYQKGKTTQYEKVWSTFLKYEPLIISSSSKYKDTYIKIQKLLHEKNRVVL